MEASEFSSLVAESCTEVLDTMYFTSVLSTEPPSARQVFQGADGMLAFSLSFTGDISGQFGLWLAAATARTLAANFLGEDEPDISEGEVIEVAGELANMFCGSVMSRVEREHTFALSHPQAMDISAFVGGDNFSVSELATECGPITVWVGVEGESCKQPV